jgi:hypothetical protein
VSPFLLTIRCLLDSFMLKCRRLSLSIGSLAGGGSEILLVDRELVQSAILTQATVDQLEQLPAL